MNPAFTRPAGFSSPPYAGSARHHRPRRWRGRMPGCRAGLPSQTSLAPVFSASLRNIQQTQSFLIAGHGLLPGVRSTEVERWSPSPRAARVNDITLPEKTSSFPPLWVVVAKPARCERPPRKLTDGMDWVKCFGGRLRHSGAARRYQDGGNAARSMVMMGDVFVAAAPAAAASALGARRFGASTSCAIR